MRLAVFLGRTTTMLQRVISIKNVGRFKNCAASGDVTFRRYTLIFAENARGKTTLCDILRSLFTNTPSIIIGRTTLGSPDPPEVQLLMASGVIGFRNGGWTAAYPDIAIFDGTYVRENVFAGDAVDTEHRRNLYQVIIGAQGVALAAALDGLETQIKTKTTDIRDNRAQMQRHMPQGMTAEAFIALEEDAEIDAKIAAKEQELQAARQSAQLQQKGGFQRSPSRFSPPPSRNCWRRRSRISRRMPSGASARISRAMGCRRAGRPGLRKACST
jgi:wobble nucleotide-excising tRNase